MRKNSPRKWLHAILDLLPLLILPIFALAVRSDNNFQPIEVQAQEYQVVDFNQLISDSCWMNNNCTLSYSNNTYNITTNGDNLECILFKDLITDISHSYLIKYKVTISEGQYRIRWPIISSYINDIGLKETIFNPIQYENVYIGFEFSNDSQYNYILSNLQLFDLTQMFGVGNEPTIEQFNAYFPNDYYEYTTSKKVLLNVGTTTLSDTDVGSQMVYTLYNAADKYFNFNNVFNFGQLYDWFVLNIFNGNATLIFSVVWQIVLYEFIMDLVFLIYALFMFFIDFCTNLIDRFHVKCSGGK